VSPVVAQKYPAGQVVHDDAPDVARNVPAAQLVHPLAAATE
jgi:hypothetical protein